MRSKLFPATAPQPNRPRGTTRDSATCLICSDGPHTSLGPVRAANRPGQVSCVLAQSHVPRLGSSLHDATADPCVDFAQYACGNFAKLYPIPNDRSGYGTGAIGAEYTETLLHSACRVW